MTKSQELTAWRAFAATMPPASTYSGKWIAEQIDFLETDLRNDHAPGIAASTMADCRQAFQQAQDDAKQTRDQADKEAATIRARATEEADAIRAKAREQAERILSQPRHALRKALDELT